MTRENNPQNHTHRDGGQDNYTEGDAIDKQKQPFNPSPVLLDIDQLKKQLSCLKSQITHFETELDSLKRQKTDGSEEERRLNVFETELIRLQKSSQNQEVEVGNLRSEVDRVNEIVQVQTRQIKSFELKILVLQKIQEDRDDYEKNQEELERNSNIANKWIQRWAEFRQILESETRTFSQAIDEAEAISSSFSEDLIQNRLWKHQEQFNVAKRMLGRLPKSLPDTKKIEHLGKLEKPIYKTQIVEFLKQSETEPSRRGGMLQTLLDQKLDTISQNRYQVTRKSSDLVKKHESQALEFVKTKILEIIDGIDLGENSAQATIDELKEQIQVGTVNQDKTLRRGMKDFRIRSLFSNDDIQEITSESELVNALEDWFETYKKLRLVLEKLIAFFDVYPMEIIPGYPVDFEKHDPLAAEPDNTLNNGDVKEVNRKGYEYLSESGDNGVLRAAQVTVVNNSSTFQSNAFEEM